MHVVALGEVAGDSLCPRVWNETNLAIKDGRESALGEMGINYVVYEVKKNLIKYDFKVCKVRA